jgi:outer membrane lipoprotein-sorting protein
MTLKLLWIAITGIALLAASPAAAQDADALIKAAVDYYRGTASIATVHMGIVRPSWQREMTIKAWTRGQKESLFYIVEPPKDKGNGTLKKGREMWTYNPKVNRVIKLPPSMMSQSWMGSDFSNNDLAKSDSIIEDYTHSLEGTDTHQGKTVYIIKSMPKPMAPVVWGMQKLHVREDFILLRQEFYDEDGQLVKFMSGDQLEMLGGRLLPKVWKMQKADVQDEYTRLEYEELEFKDDLPGSQFTMSALRNPGRF